MTIHCNTDNILNIFPDPTVLEKYMLSHEINILNVDASCESSHDGLYIIVTLTKQQANQLKALSHQNKLQIKGNRIFVNFYFPSDHYKKKKN